MYRIIDSRCSGKTCRLLVLAKENNAIIATSNPKALEEKAHRLGIVGIEFIGYDKVNGYKYDKPVYIDELERYVKSLNNNFQGYTLSNED
jgi:hypothetical protein